ncbi:MAG: DEAD/DEAH box helicase, partial [Thermoanaerobaculia bacterium]|nr:DEAD/DEAH box helicase [Thermoanaerobaculia bacterium]
LRGYQKIGLGWLEFLADLGLGGCLADDMGLGKTVQVLALLQAHHRRNKAESEKAGKGNPSTSRPSLVVAPRSLVYNWVEETGRFAPELKIETYLGSDRKKVKSRFAEVDIVVTTYGTLRRDILSLRTQPFEFVILDEAQAIKNSSSQTAKATRLLQAEHRLALTGTPIENHLGELWSIFEFLNPGMLGNAPRLEALIDTDPAEADQKPELRRALSPFILRRTKGEVLSELPPKTEQVLRCQLGTKERVLYDELRAHYRASLVQRFDEVGLNQSKIQVLEALLRLRQASCHPGLLDASRVDEPSTKIDLLVEQLQEVLEGGHKALVFSQFTSLLAIVRKRLEAAGIVYEYLDGKTRDRGARVDRFQEDPDCPVFLISLKAGGVGLNLTAASYVYLLDPWWNPAVEAQAIDRAHRIGQDQPVFAYRLIAEDTVEEKILLLQDSKRDLAEAILQADGSAIQKLTSEDLLWILG